MTINWMSVTSTWILVLLFARYGHLQKMKNMNHKGIPIPLAQYDSEASASSSMYGWDTTFPNNEIAGETAEIRNKEKITVITSEKVPDGSGFFNSSSLIDSKNGKMATKILWGNSSICFFTTDTIPIGKVHEELRRRSLLLTVKLGIPMEKYALIDHRANINDLWRMGGNTVFNFCRDADIYYHLVTSKPDSIDTPMQSTIKVSGLVSPSQPGISIPLCIRVDSKLDFSSMNVTFTGMSDLSHNDGVTM